MSAGEPESDPKPPPLPVLTTERLVLRALTDDDAPAIFAFARSRKVAEFTLWKAHATVADSLAFIRGYAANHYADGAIDPLGIELKSAPGVVIGTTGCFWVSKKSKHMELAYALAEPHWGKGIVLEASTAVLNHVFGRMDVSRVQARCRKDNDRSRRVMEKLRMTYEGAIEVGLLEHGLTVDLLVYSLLREEWAGRRSQGTES